MIIYISIWKKNFNSKFQFKIPNWRNQQKTNIFLFHQRKWACIQKQFFPFLLLNWAGNWFWPAVIMATKDFSCNFLMFADKKTMHCIACLKNHIHFAVSKKGEESLDNDISFLMTKLFHQIRHQIPNFECNKHIDYEKFWYRIWWTAKAYKSIICRNDKLSWTMSWVGCLSTDYVLPDAWKWREWEYQKFWEGFVYFLQIR